MQFQNEGFVQKQVDEHVDYLIIKSVLKTDKKVLCFIIPCVDDMVADYMDMIGNDMNLLEIMQAFTTCENIFRVKPERSKTEDDLYGPAALDISPHIRYRIYYSCFL